MEYTDLIQSRRNHFTWDYSRAIPKEDIVDVFHEVYMNVPTKNLMYPYVVTLFENSQSAAKDELFTICHRNQAHSVEQDAGNPQMLAPWIIGIGPRDVVHLETRYDPVYRRSNWHVDLMDSFESGMLATYIMLGLQNRGYNTGISQNCVNNPERCAQIIGSPVSLLFLIGVGYGTNDPTYFDPRTLTNKNVPFDINNVPDSRQSKFTEGNPSFTDVFNI